jgi:hypothetical protein
MLLLSYVYFVLAFAETLVLFASIIGLLVFAVRLAAEKINNLADAASDWSWPGTEPRVKRPSRLSVAVQSGSHQIPGGHNERL